MTESEITEGILDMLRIGTIYMGSGPLNVFRKDYDGEIVGKCIKKATYLFCLKSLEKSK